MKNTNTILYLLLPVIFCLIFISCKKEYCTTCNYNTNTSSVLANAGRDTIYQWPIDSILLDGSKSFTVNDSLTQFYWKKITGPDVSISTPLKVKTYLSNINLGDYMFEITVRNSKGITSNSTVRISFNYNCRELELHIEKGQGNLSLLGRIPNSYGKITPFLLNDNIIVPHENARIEFFDIYNLTTNLWTPRVPSNTNYATAIGSRILGNYLLLTDFSGNSSKLYDPIKNKWISLDYPYARTGTIESYNDLLYIAGGFNNYWVTTDQISILNVQNGTNSREIMSQNRAGVSIVGNKNKVFFAGGYRSIVEPSSIYDDDGHGLDYTTRVDIYDLLTKTWSSSELSQARADIKAIASDDKVIFAGGTYYDAISGLLVNSDRVDIYDIPTKTWTIAFLINPLPTEPKMYAIENKIFFVPVSDNGRLQMIDVYDLLNNQWSTLKFSNHWLIGSVAVAGNKLLFSRTGPTGISSVLDIYDVSTNTWSETALNMGFKGQIVSDGKHFYLVGGFLSKLSFPPDCIDCSIIPIPSCSVYKLTY